jgi:uncharacterized protein (DUF1330 family)
MSHILPTEEQFENLHAIPDDAPLVMVNMLRFKPEGGEALYDRYSQLALKILDKIGASVIYYGSDIQTFIGEDAWDVILLVQYPSRSVFVKMLADNEYLEVSQHRTEALEDSRLYVTRPHGGAWDNR